MASTHIFFSFTVCIDPAGDALVLPLDGTGTPSEGVLPGLVLGPFLRAQHHPFGSVVMPLGHQARWAHGLCSWLAAPGRLTERGSWPSALGRSPVGSWPCMAYFLEDFWMADPEVAPEEHRLLPPEAPP